MQKNLVIVESPAKAKTIEKFLGTDYKVLSSYGHIRDLKKKEFSIDINTFTPEYEIPKEKEALVADLKKAASAVETVWLASDEDREGEAISWHLSEVLGLDPDTTKRIVFHEITKPAILDAILHPRKLDLNLVNAQQSRRVLDRIVGFKLSPVLWKKVKPSLSAGRVQSVAVRLIVEREREISAFKSESSYRVVAVFQVPSQDGTSVTDMKAELNTRFKTQQEAENFLKDCINSQYKIEDIVTRPQKRMPAAPFTTSTLQQEAARKLSFTVAQTMSLAQRLYESGRITYMRTDSTNLSTLCVNACRDVVQNTMGPEYVKSRQYHTKVKGAQEAHEAIRPTDMEHTTIDASLPERRLYELIWKRTIASQMADAELEKTTVSISIDNRPEQFMAVGEVVKFDGFLKVYRPTTDEESNAEEAEGLLPVMTIGQHLDTNEMQATERYTQRPPRYTEASLVHKMEELGIGRPSTYAPTISTIQQREYVVKSDMPGEQRSVNVMRLSEGHLTKEVKTETTGAEKGKLLPTDVGIVVTEYLIESFPQIMDYNFTAAVEKDFDEVAEGKMQWTNLMRHFYEEFEPLVEKSLSTKSDRRVGERALGNDPKTGKPVSVKIGRFGPVVQLGSTDDEVKPNFAPLPKGLSLETITLEEALELFKLPRVVGKFEDEPVTIGSGRFGPYILHKKKYISLNKEYDPITVTLEETIKQIIEKRRSEEKSHLKQFTEDADLEVRDGRYGAYLSYKGKNYRLPKDLVEKATELTYEQCKEVIDKADSAPETTTRRKKKTK